MKKKLLCLVLLVSLMAGCGNTVQDSKETEVKDGKTAIEFWYGLGGKPGETMEGLIKDFNDSQERIQVIGIQQSEYKETKKMVQAAVAAKIVPAAVLLGYQDLRQFDQRGIIEPLDSYIEEDKDFHLEDFTESFLSYCINEDKATIGLPVYGTTQVMYYRKDLFEKAGIDPEEAFLNWQSLAEAAKKLSVKKDGKTVVYGWEPMYGDANMKDIAFSNGAVVLSENGKKVLINTKEWVEPWECIRKWIHEDEIMQIHFGGDGWEYWYKTMDDVMQGRAAGYTGSSGDQADLDFTIIGAHGQPGFMAHKPSPYVDSLNSAILKQASEEQKKAGFEWLSYLTSAKGTSAFALKCGYVPVRSSATEEESYKAYLEEFPHARIPVEQAKIAQLNFIDPTGGKIDQAILDAVDLVQIENIPAQEALDQAQVIAQKALDEFYAGN